MWLLAKPSWVSEEFAGTRRSTISFAGISREVPTAFPQVQSLSVGTHNGGADGWGVIHGSYGRSRWISSG